MALPAFVGGRGAGTRPAAPDPKAQQQQLLQQYGPQVVSALNSGDYNAAWKAALASEQGWGGSQNVGAAATDPLIASLESAGGLHSLDPSLTMNASQIQQYYDAFAKNTGTYAHGAGGTGFNGNLVGKNPYGIWGTAADSMAGVDAQAGVNAKAGGLADISNYLGARQDPSFLGKYGTAIATVAGDIGGSFIGDPMLGNQLVGLYDATQGNWGGALTNIASGFVPGAGAALGTATGLGSGVGTALVGAGVGAAGAGLSGGNVLTGALTGGVGGYLGGSGLQGQLGNSLGGGALGNAAAGGLVGAGTGALGAALGRGNIGAGALAGGVGGATRGGLQGSGVSSGLAGVGGALLGGYAANAAFGGGGGTSNIGNIGNMASNTDSTLASAVTGALPGLVQGAAGVYGAQAGTDKATAGINQAIDTQNSTLGNINNIWSTQRGLGQGAQTALGTALGTNGQPADYSGFENMPGYQFAIQQGTQAIQRQAAAMGNAYTPNTAAAVGQYVTGTAMQDYNTYINQLMGAAGLGSTANAGVANPTYQTGANISGLQSDKGVWNATGVNSAANAIGNTFGPNGAGGSLIGAAAKYVGGLGGGGSGGNSGTPELNPSNTNFGAGTNFNANAPLPAGTFDPNSVQMPSVSAPSDYTNFGGGQDYASTDPGLGIDFLGNLGGP